MTIVTNSSSEHLCRACCMPGTALRRTVLTPFTSHGGSVKCRYPRFQSGGQRRARVLPTTGPPVMDTEWPAKVGVGARNEGFDGGTVSTQREQVSSWQKTWQLGLGQD